MKNITKITDDIFKSIESENNGLSDCNFWYVSVSKIAKKDHTLLTYIQLILDNEVGDEIDNPKWPGKYWIKVAFELETLPWIENYCFSDGTYLKKYVS